MSPADDPRPGPLAWGVIVAGWAIVAVGVLGALGDERLGGTLNWVGWLVGAAIVHDAVVLPAVLLTGWFLGRILPPVWRTPLRAALCVAAVTALTVWPIARRWGARADNPSILPLEVQRNLTWIVAAILLAGLAVGAMGTIRSGRTSGGVRGDPPTSEEATTT